MALHVNGFRGHGREDSTTNHQDWSEMESRKITDHAKECLKTKKGIRKGRGGGGNSN